MMKVSETYRLKALDCEKQSRDAKAYDIKCAWSDIAIEWHALASRAAQDAGRDCNMEKRH